MWRETTSFEELEGETIVSVEGAEPGSEEIRFLCTSGRQFKMLHYQDCCEHVRVEEVIGDILDLVREEVVSAKAESNASPEDYDGWGSATYTFYHIRTHAGDVTLRWLGESNGYYSERVAFVEVE